MHTACSPHPLCALCSRTRLRLRHALPQPYQPHTTERGRTYTHTSGLRAATRSQFTQGRAGGPKNSTDARVCTDVGARRQLSTRRKLSATPSPGMATHRPRHATSPPLLRDTPSRRVTAIAASCCLLRQVSSAGWDCIVSVGIRLLSALSALTRGCGCGMLRRSARGARVSGQAPRGTASPRAKRAPPSRRTREHTHTCCTFFTRLLRHRHRRRQTPSRARRAARSRPSPRSRRHALSRGRASRR